MLTKRDFYKISKIRLILLVTLTLLSIFSLFVGVIDIQFNSLIQGDLEQGKVFFISRLPRLLAILCTGMGMSIAGLLMQNLCRNKFVSPTTGATISCAQFGLLLAFLYLPNSGIWGRAGLAFAAAILGTWLFVSFIQRIQFRDIIMVPLIGIMFNYVMDGATAFLAFKYNANQLLTSSMSGHFSHILRGRYELVYLVFPMLILAFYFANHFNIVGMGKNFSKNLGVSYEKILFFGLSIAAIITASIVVIVGSISYIGLIVPNIISLIRGDRIKGNFVDTALCGAIFVLLCDILARILIYPYELPISLVTGVIGSISFIGLIFYQLKRKGKS